MDGIPIGAVGGNGHSLDFLGKLGSQLLRQQTPAPVEAHGTGLVHAAGVVQAQMVLDRDDAVLGHSVHGQVQQSPVHFLIGNILVIDVIPQLLLAGLAQTCIPASQGFVVVGTGVNHAVTAVVVGQ